MNRKAEKTANIFFGILAPEYSLPDLFLYLCFKIKVGGPGWYDLYRTLPQHIQKEKGTMDSAKISAIRYDQKKRSYSGTYAYFKGSKQHKGNFHMTYVEDSKIPKINLH
jgi:hypothetical protein